MSAAQQATPSQCLMYIDNGQHIDLLNPDPDLFNLRHIIHALSRLNRWTGRSTIPVLVHSIWVAAILPDELKLQGLMHDAAEAFTGDIPAPLKPHLIGLQHIEQQLNLALARRYGYDYPFDPLVHQADRAINSAEAATVFQQVPEWARPEHWHRQSRTLARQTVNSPLLKGRTSTQQADVFLDLFKQYGGQP